MSPQLPNMPFQQGADPQDLRNQILLIWKELARRKGQQVPQDIEAPPVSTGGGGGTSRAMGLSG